MHFSANGSTTFNQNSPSAWDLDTVHEGETLVRTLAMVDAYIVQNALAPTVIDKSGWWEDTEIGIGMYTPGLAGSSGSTPGPLSGSADDFWIFRYLLTLDDVVMLPDKSLVIARYKFPQGLVDTQSRRGPAPLLGAAPVQVAWEWVVPFAYEYNSGPSFSSFLGMRFWQQSLYLHG